MACADTFVKGERPNATLRVAVGFSGAGLVASGLAWMQIVPLHGIFGKAVFITLTLGSGAGCYVGPRPSPVTAFSS
jgi:hypothetical protein